MANGYLRIKKTDIYENNGVTYWKNGANIIGNVVKCVDSDEAEHYYIESLKTRKAILLDDDVKIGGGDFGFESTNGNFILVTTVDVDFSDIGGGDGVSITFTFGNKYYTVTLPEDNGDLKIYDPDGEGGETGADPLPDVTDASAGDVLSLDSDKKPVWNPIPDELPDTAAASVGDALVLDSDKKPVWTAGGAKYYSHSIYFAHSGGAGFYGVITIIDKKSTDLTIAEVAQWLYDHMYNSRARVYPCPDIKIRDNNLLICDGLYSSSGTHVTFNPNVISVSGNVFSLIDYGGNNITTISSQVTNEL